MYFVGWLFRNPQGLKKFRKELISAFTPKKAVKEKVNIIIGTLRQKYKKVIGIHIRQADYKEFKGGMYFINQIRVREIINEFIQKNSIDKNETVFFIASDGPVDLGIFHSLNMYISK